MTPQQAAGYQHSAMRIVLKASPPNVFIGGPVPNSPGFPLKACGNDGLGIANLLNPASCGNRPTEIELETSNAKPETRNSYECYSNVDGRRPAPERLEISTQDRS